MPALPWARREAPDPEREYVTMASRLTLSSYWSIPGFMRATMAIRRQLAKSEGLVGYSLKTDLPHKTFFTYSAWVDDASLQTFAAAQPHAGIMRAMKSKMSDTHFEFFETRGRDLPEPWKRVVMRVMSEAEKGTPR
jgi:hypothetical protein